jgi:G3E family GTPase
LVANDQSSDLVDTQWLRAQGFHVGEVPGACFCCKFTQLTETIASLRRAHEPDIIIAEPVGSCSDLTATVLEPLRRLRGTDYELAPLLALLKPEHGVKILRRDRHVGFSPKAAYLFLKQLQEADVIVVNKIDKLETAERDELIQLASEWFPGKRVLAASARTGEGFDAVIEAAGEPAPKHTAKTSAYSDVCEAGEAELAWLSCRLEVEGEPFALDDLLVKVLENLRQALFRDHAEPVHVKLLGLAEGGCAIGNLVGAESVVELSEGSGVTATSANLTLNARVAAEPARLEAALRHSLGQLTETDAVRYNARDMKCFRPGRPAPVHQIT